MRKLGGSDRILTLLKQALIGRGGAGGLGGVLPLFGGGMSQSPLKAGPVSGMVQSSRTSFKLPSVSGAKSSITAGSSATPTAPQPNKSTV